MLRFDYWGCGDGPGQFRDATLRTRLEDIAAARRYLAEVAETDEIILLGLRFGATLAAGAVSSGLPACGLALIEPVPDGAKYFDLWLKRRRVRQMMTAGRAEEEGAGGEILDLDGHAVPRQTIDELRGLRIAEETAGFEGAVLVVQVSFNRKLRPATEGVRLAFEAAGAQVEVRALRLPPFWSRIEIIDTAPVNEAVVGWLEELSSAGAEPESST